MRIVIPSEARDLGFLATTTPLFLRQSPMRTLLILFATTAALAQSAQQTQTSYTTENLRGVSAVSPSIAWASGTHGTYLRTTDAGRTWIPAQVPGAEALDFRGVVAFSPSEAFLMSAGPGDQSRIYHTADSGQHWQLQFTNENPKGFFDSMVFWDPTHGLVLGDPIPDETGKLKFELLMTNDGQSWTQLPPSQLPPALEGEAAFAASNTCLAILRVGKGGDLSRAVNASEKNGASAPDPNIWFATGGKAARVFHSPDRGQTWEVFDTPSSTALTPPESSRSPSATHPRRNRRRRLQTPRAGRTQPRLHHRRRQNLDALQNLPPGLLLRRSLRPQNHKPRSPPPLPHRTKIHLRLPSPKKSHPHQPTQKIRHRIQRRQPLSPGRSPGSRPQRLHSHHPLKLLHLCPSNSSVILSGTSACALSASTCAVEGPLVPRRRPKLRREFSPRTPHPRPPDACHPEQSEGPWFPQRQCTRLHPTASAWRRTPKHMTKVPSPHSPSCP